MRNILIIISIILFVLSGIITFKALGVTAKSTHYQVATQEVSRQEVPPKVEELLGQVAREQAANRALVKELQDTISNLEDKLSIKDEEIKAQVETEKPVENVRVLAVLGSGYFSSGQVEIDEKLINTIKKFVPDILAYPDHQVVIEGHTDNIPVSLSYGKRYRDNMELSFLRAKAIALILAEQGISLENIRVTGYGDTRPVAPNDTKEGRIKNRRVEVKLITGQKGL